jgi:hypothetical protein
MKAPIDRALVTSLLADQSLSYREIARLADCSDWSVRSIARQLDHDGTEEVPNPEPLTAFEWWVVLGVGALVIAGLSFAAWRKP